MDELIKKIKQGNKESATELVKLYYDEIYFYVLKLTLNKDLSYDLTQEIFIRVLRKINTLKDHRNIKAWIYKVAYNYVMSFFKATKNYKFATSDHLEFMPAKTNIEDEIQNKDTNKKLLSAVFKLENNYKDPILLRYYHNLTIPEIAAILSLNENTVKTYISRGLDKLKLYIEGGETNE